MMVFIRKGRKLEGSYDFQGLPISIETKKGSKRHWYDPFNNTEGSTTMLYDYGYVSNTLGTDGDAVDVYVGPNKTSTKVFVITQAKTPDFKEIDEQKCMLGFNSEEEAKTAYLAHYNDPRFFMYSKEMSIEEFSQKLGYMRGQLLKGNQMNDELSKALNALIASFMRKEDEYKARIAREQPAIGSNAVFVAHEPPPVPIRRNGFYPPVVSVKPTKE